MGPLLALSRAIDAVSRVAGAAATWLVLFAALISAFNAMARYSVGSLLAFGTGAGPLSDGIHWLFEVYRNNANVMGDLQLAMFAAMVMLGAPWTLKMNEHVRVDLIYGAIGYRARAWVDLIGTILFLAPMCLVMIYFTWPWFVEAWTGNEMSQNAGGLPRWIPKFFLPAGFALVLLQGVSELIKCVAALTTRYTREAAYEKPLQ